MVNNTKNLINNQLVNGAQAKDFKAVLAGAGGNDAIISMLELFKAGVMWSSEVEYSPNALALSSIDNKVYIAQKMLTIANNTTDPALDTGLNWQPQDGRIGSILTTEEKFTHPDYALFGTTLVDSDSPSKYAKFKRINGGSLVVPNHNQRYFRYVDHEDSSGAQENDGVQTFNKSLSSSSTGSHYHDNNAGFSGYFYIMQKPLDTHGSAFTDCSIVTSSSGVVDFSTTSSNAYRGVESENEVGRHHKTKITISQGDKNTGSAGTHKHTTSISNSNLGIRSSEYTQPRTVTMYGYVKVQ